MNPTDSALPAGGAVTLSHWGVMRAQGDDAAAFLHGQLSNDVLKQTPRQARLAAYCSAQGRMLASFVVAKRGASELWLACSADVLPAALKRLGMFVLRSKVKLRDASADLVGLGLAGATAEAWVAGRVGAQDWDAAWLDDQASVVRLPRAAETARWLWIGPRDQADAVLTALPALDASTWRWLEVRAGVAQVVAATANQFVPQMLNYELVGGVDFRKGCYPGQEVVARSQYLGKLKRRGFLVEGPETLSTGQEVFWSGDEAQPAGMVALAAPSPAGGASALVELKIAAADSGSLHLGSPQGPQLVLAALPYVLPHEQGAGPA